jgi:anti-sigma factor RsiW
LSPVPSPEGWTDCAPFEELLVPFLDGELEGAEAAPLQAHLELCSSCRRALEEHRLVAAWIPRLAVEAQPPRQALLAVRGRLVRAEALRRRRRALIRGAAAAGILVAACLAAGRWSAPPAPDGPPPALQGVTLEDLEVLEALQAEAGDVTPELVTLLLEETEAGIPLDPEVFDYVLEEEIDEDKL